ncbi:MAG: caspase family protein [Bacteroidetes bacterium]|nr:caspase family protein [Bacteroidota bacterium]
MKSLIACICALIFLPLGAQKPNTVVQAGNGSKISLIAGSYNGLMYAAGDKEGTIVVWDAVNQGQVGHFHIPTDSSRSSRPGLNMLISGPDVAHAGLEDFQFVDAKGLNEVAAITFNPSNTYLAASDQTGRVFWWEIETRSLKGSLPPFKSGKSSLKVRKLAYDRSGNYLLIQGSQFYIYSLSENRVVYNNPDIVAFDRDIAADILYFIEKGTNKKEQPILSLSRSKKGIVDFMKNSKTEPLKSKLCRSLHGRQGLMPKFKPENLNLIVADSHMRGIKYGQTLAWEENGRYHLRTTGGFVNDGAGTFAITPRHEVALAQGELYLWRGKDAKNLSKKWKNFVRTNAVSCDALRDLLLVNNGNSLQALDRYSGRTLQFGGGDFSVISMEKGAAQTLYNRMSSVYDGWVSGIRTFNYTQVPPVSNYIPGTHRFYSAVAEQQIALTRRNRIQLRDADNRILHQKVTDNHTMFTQPIMWFVRGMYLMGGMYVVARTSHWSVAVVKNAAYSQKHNLLFYYTQKIPYGGQRIEVFDVTRNKKRPGIKVYGKDISALALSGDEAYLTSAGKNCVLCEKTSISVHPIENIGTRKNKPVLRIADSASRTAEHLALCRNWLAVGTREVKEVFETRKNKTILIGARKTQFIRLFQFPSGQVSDTLYGTSGPFAFTHNGKMLCYARKQSLVLYNPETRTEEVTWPAHTAPVTSVAWDSAHGQIITSSMDGSIIFWDGDTHKKLASLFQGKNEFVLLTPDGYYTASARGTSAVGYGLGTRFISFEQYDLQYNRPDIVYERLGWYGPEVTGILRMAREKRLKHFGFDSSLFKPDPAMLPAIEIQNKWQIPMETTQQEFLLRFRSSSGADPVERLRLEINGVPLFGSHGLLYPKNGLDSLRFPLNAGDNEVKLYLVTRRGFESIREVLRIRYVPEKKEIPQTWTIHIGAGKFADSSMNLRYAAKDASDLKNFFQTRKNVRSLLLTDDQVTRKNLLALRDTLLRTKPGDRVIVTYSGHGVLSRNYDYFLSTSETDFENPENTCISYSDLLGILDSIPARHKLLLLDACHSGDIDREGTQLIQTEDTAGIHGGFSARGARLGNATEQNTAQAFALMQNLFVQVNNGNGTTVCSASAGTDYALESTAWGNGAFTYCLLKGLRKRKADKNHNKTVELSEMKKYLLKEVPALTQGRQQPGFRIENLQDDWVVW